MSFLLNYRVAQKVAHFQHIMFLGPFKIQVSAVANGPARRNRAVDSALTIPAIKYCGQSLDF